MSSEEIFNERKNKFLRIGRNKGFMNNLDDLSSLKIPERNLTQIFRSNFFLISIFGVALISIILLISFL